MTERPIIFSAPMVRALLAGRKTQTRRVLKPQPNRLNGGKPLNDGYGNYSVADGWRPYRFRKGDRLWVRETWTPETDRGIGYPPPHDDGRPIRWDKDEEDVRYWTQPHYRATDPEPDLVYADSDGPTCRWRPSIHMPRWASRLTLVVTNVRAQRLQDISDDDAIAEGVEPWGSGTAFVQLEDAQTYSTVRGCFAALWDSIHGPEAWAANPWVVAISFTLAGERD